ncbi:MAG: hypothetical protein IKR11_01640 [Solobacterium sp.]|nr:hypothetical protein [Solobacterium sp.]
MKKIILRLIVTILFLSVLTGCNTTVDTDNSSSVSSDYNIIYDDASVFIDAPDHAEEGEEVVLKTEQLSSPLTFYIDKEEITFQEEDNYLIYSFIMPDHNVYISCQKTNEYIGVPENATVLVDSFNRITGTVMTQPYSEIVLYEAEPNDILAVYKNGDTEDETVSRYYVSKDAYPKILKIILDLQMDTWNDLEDTYPIDGAFYVVRFWDGEKQVRVTSDDMPSDGMQAFYTVDNAMYALLNEATFYEKEDIGLQKTKDKNKDGIVTKGQLLNWLEELDINEYTSIVSVVQEKMKKDDIEYNYINVYLDEGYFPGDDLSIILHETILWKMFLISEKDESDDEVGSDYYWRLNNGKRYCTSMYTQDNIELKDWYISEASGTILHYNIPDEYIQEDEKGKYILFESSDQKYYLDGTIEILKENGESIVSDDLWTDDPYFYNYYEY